MATFGEVIARVRKDLRATAGLRLDDDDIKDAINDAIWAYRSTRFFFNEGNADNGLGATIATVAGTESYAIPSTVLEIDQVQYLNANHQYRLTRWHWADYIRAISDVAAITGSPTHYAVQGRYFHLYPTPDQATTVTIYGLVQLDPYPLTASASENGWTNEALPLIRARADWDLSLNRLANPDMAANFATAETAARQALMDQTNAYIAVGHAHVDRWDCI